MQGNTLSEFINDLLETGGPEKEFMFREKRYFLETVYRDDMQMIEMYIIDITDNDTQIGSFFGNDYRECVEQFEKAKIFDGKTIYEAESEIVVLFG